MQIICMSKLSHFEFGTSLAKNQGEINPSALVVNGRLLRYHCTYLSLLPVFKERTVICSGIPRCKQASKQTSKQQLQSGVKTRLYIFLVVLKRLLKCFCWAMEWLWK